MSTQPLSPLRIADILARFQIDRRTLERWRSSGHFPPPARTIRRGRGKGIPYWDEGTVSRWFLNGQGGR